MQTIFLTSCLDTYDKDINGNRIAKHFGNKNNILDNLKKYIKKFDNFLFVASDEYNTEYTDLYANAIFESFDMTLPFKKYEILDIRTEDKIDDLINKADFIFLCGGHLPTQNKFFNKINLKEKLYNTNAIICGGSAGSMNCAIDVYCPPEIEGESLDESFNRYLSGLGITNINILPHFSEFRNYILDGKKYIEEIIIPDSFKNKIYAINDGTYFIIDNGITTLYGEAYIIEDGKIIKINEDSKRICIE